MPDHDSRPDTPQETVWNERRLRRTLGTAATDVSQAIVPMPFHRISTIGRRRRARRWAIAAVLTVIVGTGAATGGAALLRDRPVPVSPANQPISAVPAPTTTVSATTTSTPAGSRP